MPAAFRVPVLARQPYVDFGAAGAVHPRLPKAFGQGLPGGRSAAVAGHQRALQVVGVQPVGLGLRLALRTVVVLGLPQRGCAPAAVGLPAVAFGGLPGGVDFLYQAFVAVEVPGGGLLCALAGGFADSAPGGVVLVVAEERKSHVRIL